MNHELWCLKKVSRRCLSGRGVVSGFVFALGAALLSRFIKLIPQSYIVQTMEDNRTFATIKQHFNPFVLKYTMSILDDNPPIDRRLLLSAGVLLAAIEGRQD